MRDLHPTPFTLTEYNRLLGGLTKHIQIISTGVWHEYGDDYRREIVLVAYREKPAYVGDIPHYFMDIADSEVRELAESTDYVVFIERGRC